MVTRMMVVAAGVAACLGTQALAAQKAQAPKSGQPRKSPEARKAVETGRAAAVRPAAEARRSAPLPKPGGDARHPAEASKAGDGAKAGDAGRVPASQAAGLAPAIDNPRVTCDRWPSNYDAASWIQDVWRLENAGSGEQKVLALYKWVRLQQHWGEQCFDGTRGTNGCECDAIKKINIYPYGECSDFGVTSAALGHAGGLKTEEAHVPGHTQLEAFYKDADGADRWHRLDPFWGVVVYDRTGSHIATWEEMKADPNLALQPVKTVEPWGDKATDRKRFAEKAACQPDRRVRPSRYTMDKPLYPGEVYILSWDRLPGIGFYNANPESRDKMNTWGWIRYQYAQGDEAKLSFGHELLRPFVEKVDGQLQVHEAHGTLLFKPLMNERFADSLYAPAVNVAVGPNGYALRPAKARVTASVVYLVQTPYVIIHSGIAGDFRTGPADRIKVSIARADWREEGYTLDQVIPARPDWKVIWESKGEGRQEMRLREADLGLRGEYKFLVKVEMTAASEPILAGMDAIGFVVRFQEGIMALPRLLPGRNVIRVTAGRIDPRYNLHVKYVWDDPVGHEREVDKTIGKVPFEFEVQAAGSQPADVRSRAVILQAVHK